MEIKWIFFCVCVCCLTQDEFQEHYRRTGRFPGPIASPPRRPWALLNWLFWVCLLVYPLCRLLLQLLLSGSTFTAVCTFVICFAGTWDKDKGMGWLFPTGITNSKIKKNGPLKLQQVFFCGQATKEYIYCSYFPPICFCFPPKNTI